MDNEATVREIKPPNQARRPWTCDFDFITCHPFDVSWDRGVWVERQGGKKQRREGGREGVLLLAHSGSHIVVERQIKQNKY